jgi:hypothetical protein
MWLSAMQCRPNPHWQDQDLIDMKRGRGLFWGRRKVHKGPVEKVSMFAYHGYAVEANSLRSSILKELEDGMKVASVETLIETQMAWCGCLLMKDV